MSNVGIMTWFQYHNYGTALQITAMCEILRKTGYTPVVIKYYTKPYRIERTNKLFIRSFVLKVARRLKVIGKSQYSTMGREKKFEEFLSKHLLFTRKCDTLSELVALNDEFDFFICGSDQIWAPSWFDPHYFLDFVLDNSKKIAYAPSLGLPKIENDDIKREMARLCSSFAYLSTREESGSKIIRDITGRKVETVLDPTLLLSKNDWKKFEPKEIHTLNKPYLLVYMLGQNKQHWYTIYRIAKNLKLKLKIIPVFWKDFLRNGGIKFSIGPAEFLTLFKNASYVCTDSFHGMVFSVNFNKQFTVFERFKKHDAYNQNSRIYNLTSILNLNDRIFRKEADIKMIDSKIDYERVSKVRKALVNDSVEYLKTALGAVTTYQSSEKKQMLNDQEKKYYQ